MPQLAATHQCHPLAARSSGFSCAVTLPLSAAQSRAEGPKLNGAWESNRIRASGSVGVYEMGSSIITAEPAAGRST
jgi:hypothetical protein